MADQKYHAGEKYTNGDRTVTYREKRGVTIHFSENREAKKLNQNNFYKLKLEPVNPLGNMDASRMKPVQSKEAYKKQSDNFFMKKRYAKKTHNELS